MEEMRWYALWFLRRFSNNSARGVRISARSQAGDRLRI
jgi:hypothetical protein